MNMSEDNKTIAMICITIVCVGWIIVHYAEKYETIKYNTCHQCGHVKTKENEQ